MTTTVKVIIAGAVIFSLGMIILIVSGCAAGWSFDYDANWDMKTYECNDPISNVDLEFSAGTLKVQFYDGDVIKVEYPENKQITSNFSVSGQTLKMETSKLRWHVSLWGLNKIPTTKMFIPQNLQIGWKIKVNAGVVSFESGEYKDVDIRINAGTLSFGDSTFGNLSVQMNAGTTNMEGINCSKVDVDMNAGSFNVANIVSNSFTADISAGSLNVKKLQCDDIAVDLSAGSANLKIAGKKSDYTIKTDVSAGSCNVKSQSGGSKRLTVDVSAGSVNISFDE
ncbi:MAG: DUF4097 family beta strand repeat protein [Clostridiales bacterium]|nr:DUF4097 family beta strand repeat protein [Clostridiales bacterium]